MKHGSFRAIGLILMACIAVLSAFGDEYTVDLETKILETFDKGDEAPYDWRFEASKFATKTKDADGNVTDSWPKVTYVPAWPSAFFGYNPENKDTLKSLGIWGKFDRRGYNWIDIYPVETGAEENAQATEIPIPGRIRFMDIWVWGANLRYTLEAYVRDYQGVIHVINFGSLNHGGWKNLRAAVPASVPQAQRTIPRFQGLKFVKFRIWTDPTERVDGFYVYLDQFKILTDLFETPYDGDELADPAKVQEFWNQGGGE